MATLARRPARCVGTISGNQPQIRAWPVGSTLAGANAGKRGDFVKEGAGVDAGKLVLAASPIAADNTLLGLLAHGVDATARGGWYLGSSSVGDSGGTFGGTFAGLVGGNEFTGGHVFTANDDNIFELCNDAASSLADLGAEVQIELTSGIWEINVAGVTKSAVVIAIPNYPGEAIGDINQRYWVQILPAASALF